jgi:hypothetical protein
MDRWRCCCWISWVVGRSAHVWADEIALFEHEAPAICLAAVESDRSDVEGVKLGPRGTSQCGSVYVLQPSAQAPSGDYWGNPSIFLLQIEEDRAGRFRRGHRRRLDWPGVTLVRLGSTGSFIDWRSRRWKFTAGTCHARDRWQ